MQTLARVLGVVIVAALAADLWAQEAAKGAPKGTATETTKAGAGREAGGPRARRAGRERGADDFKASRLLMQAEEYLTAKETERGVKMLQTIIDQNPESFIRFQAWTIMGKHYLELQRSADAIRALTHFKVLDRNSELKGEQLDIYLEGTYYLGVAYYEGRQYTAAFPVLRKITKNNPNTVWANQAYYYIGMCHYRMESWNSCIEALSLVGTSVDRDAPNMEYMELGQRYYVRIEDADLPVVRRLGKTVKVEVKGSSGDREEITCVPLNRKGDSYIGSIPTTVGKVRPTQIGDGTLQLLGGDNITAIYLDENTFRGERDLPRTCKTIAVSTGRVEFTLGTYEGRATVAYIDQPVFIVVHDADLDKTDAADKVRVKVMSRYKEEIIEDEGAPDILGVNVESLMAADDKKKERWVTRDEVEVELTERPAAVEMTSAEKAAAAAGAAAVPVEKAPADKAAAPADKAAAPADKAAAPADKAAAPARKAAAPADTAIRSGEFCGSGNIIMAATGAPVDREDKLLACREGDEVVVTYLDSLHIAGTTERTMTAKLQVSGKVEQRATVDQKIVKDPREKSEMNLVESEAFLELGRIFRDMGLTGGAGERCTEGLGRLSEVLTIAAKEPLPVEMIEKTYQLKWQSEMVMGDFPAAMATCGAFNSRYPESPIVDKALKEMGMIHMESGDYDKAIAVFQQILALTKSEVKAEAQFRMGECIESRETIRIEKARAMGTAGDKLGNPLGAAIPAYQACSERFPDSEFAGPALAKQVDYHFSTKDYANAEALLERVFDEHPDGNFLDSMLIKWVLLAYQKKDYQLAYDKCTKLMFEYPDSPYASKAKDILKRLESKVGKGTGGEGGAGAGGEGGEGGDDAGAPAGGKAP